MRVLFRKFRIQNLINVAFVIFVVYLLKTVLNLLSPSHDSLSDGSPGDYHHLPDPGQFFAEYELTKTPDHKKLQEQATSIFKPKTMEKMDWHNYTQIELEAKREGIGEQGKPAKLPASASSRERILYDVNGYNGALSDQIPLNRSLPDIRHKGCKKKLYLKDLPDVTVVVPFHNEHFTTLVRTASSVLLRSPEHLIREIFLVDDASTKEELKRELDLYLFKHMPKVKVLRLERRSGLIAARLAGAKVAKGSVLIFLDAHTEANVNWLPPLLEPIAIDYRTSVCPFIDVVAYDTFEYRAQDEGARGAFDWEFFYKRLPVLPRDLKNMPDPFESPVMAGGLFAISRHFFWELGGYDPGLDIWGGEQYELSFKIWQCGGRLIDAPCSRVGHIYRKFAPFPNPGHGDFVGKNYRRVAEVWMDEYAKYLYRRRPQYLTIPPGDISQQKAIRDKLKCKPFKWFMTQVAFDLTAKYPVEEPKPYAEGRIRPVLNKSLCLNMRNQAEMESLLITSCNDKDAEIQFELSWHRDIRSKKRTMCYDVPDSSPGRHVVLYSCHGEAGNQLWRYHLATQQLKWSGESKCLQYNVKENEVVIDYCDDRDKTQRWVIDVVHEDLLKSWKNNVQRITGPVEKWP